MTISYECNECSTNVFMNDWDGKCPDRSNSNYTAIYECTHCNYQTSNDITECPEYHNRIY